MWKGGRTKHSDGYTYRHVGAHHPYAWNGYVLEHRFVMERHLQKTEPASPFLVKLGENLYLSPDFVVHHKDENKANNAPSNLECMTDVEHTRLHSLKRSGNERALTNAEKQKRYKAKKAAG